MAKAIVQEYERGYESTRWEKERGFKGMIKNNEFPMLSKSLNLHFVITSLIKRPYHQ